MWMNKIMIKSFGGLKDVTLELKPGFTNIVWENEAGKSTIMAFIKMMFYSKVPGGSDISKNLRKKYLPWDESKMEGAIEFQVGDDSYRLEKSFGKTAAGDKVHLIHLNSAKDMKVAKDVEIGQQFLDMDLAAFEKTIFIQNTGMISGSGEKDSVAEKILNLSNGMEEEVSMEQVLKRLLTAKEDLVSKSGRTGELVRRKEMMENLEQERNRLIAREEEQREVTALIEEKKQRAKETAQKIQKIKELLGVYKIKELLQYSEEEEVAVKKKEEYWKKHLFVTKEHKERCQELKEWLAKEEAVMETQRRNLQELNEQQGEKIKRRNEMQRDFEPEGEEIKTKEMQQLKQRLAQIKQEQILDLEKEKGLDYDSMQQGESSALQEMQEKIANIKKEKDEAASKGKKMVLMSVVLLLLGGVLFSVSSLAGTVVLAVAVMILCFGIGKGIKTRAWNAELEALKAEMNAQEEKEAKQRKLRKQAYEEKKEELHRRKQEWIQEEAELNRKLEEGYGWLSKWQVKKEQMMALDLEIQGLTEKIKGLEHKNSGNMEEIQQRRAELSSIFGLYHVSEISELEQRMKQQQLLEEEISGKRLKVETLYAAFGMERMSIQELRKRIQEAEAGYRKDELESSQNEWKQRLDELQYEYETLLQEQNELYKKCQKLEQNPEDLEQRIKELKAENQDMEQYYDAVRIAYEAMNETTQEIRQSFGPKLNEKTAGYFRALTNDAYEDVLVQSDYGIMALKKGDVSYHSYKYLSQGTIDQAYLALRLALIEIISEEMAGQRLPLFLDDIFMQYDEPRRKSGVAFLKEYAKEGQVILFTPRAVE
ncbi:MAG: AAA family ATPase [Lachnospiraceae bacterium]|nr:AAA family ATPase [Lachnospiraceae bacterium]